MKKIIYVIALFTSVMNAQVGIGTTNPTSKLEIDATADAIPALEIVPVTTVPTGSESGQMIIKDGSLFIYDSVRGKWLSSETMIYPFGNDGGTNNRRLDFAGLDNQTNSGAKILKNATIVGITSMASGGNNTKSFNIIERNGTTTINTNTFSLTALNYSSTTTNIDITAGNYITIFTPNDTSVNSPTVILHIKWRE